MPVYAAVSADSNGDQAIVGFAAGLDARKAMMRAGLEMCQMELAQELSLLKREQDGEDALSPLDKLWIDRYRRLNTRSCPQLDCEEAPLALASIGQQDQLAGTLDRLARKGLLRWEIEAATSESSGNRRRRFELTAEGRQAVRTAHTVWSNLFEGVEPLLGDS